MMNEIATIRFLDANSGDEAVAIVRAMKTQIALCLSLREGGDIETFLQVKDCESLVKALERAILAAKDC